MVICLAWPAVSPLLFSGGGSAGQFAVTRSHYSAAAVVRDPHSPDLVPHLPDLNVHRYMLVAVSATESGVECVVVI